MLIFLVKNSNFGFFGLCIFVKKLLNSDGNRYLGLIRV